MTYNIAFQGAHYAYSEMAAKQFLGNDAVCSGKMTFEDVFDSVNTVETELGIIPIENTLYGSIHRNFDLLLENDVQIVGETNLRIELHLIALPGVKLGDIKTVYSHPAALEQCRKFLTSIPHAKAVSTYDTAGSVKMIHDDQLTDCAAVAGRAAANDYGMSFLRQEIEDFPENYTRFFIISKNEHIFGEPNKTSIVFSTKNIPGALFKSLSVFFLRDINLTKIESRPLKGKPFEYLFYLDFNGHLGQERCRNALRHLEELTNFIKVLGSYPAANHIGTNNHD